MPDRICLVVTLCLTLAGGRAFSATAFAEPLEPGSTLCLHRLEVPFEDGEERRINLEKRLRDALVAAAFEVPDPQAVSDLVKRVQTDLGGFVDTALGHRDATRYAAFREKVSAALRDELGCDAELSARVVQVRARFSGGTAYWDGTTDSVSSTGRVVLQAIGGVHEHGWVTALSLWLQASDLEGNDFAFRSAGIESLVNLAVVRDQDVLPEDKWLTDVEKLDGAIRSAVGPNGEGLRVGGSPFGNPAASPTPSAEELYRRSMRRPDGLRDP